MTDLLLHGNMRTCKQQTSFGKSPALEVDDHTLWTRLLHVHLFPLSLGSCPEDDFTESASGQKIAGIRAVLHAKVINMIQLDAVP